MEACNSDGRRPYGAIAEEVGLSEAAVRRRVQRLREAGVMQIVAVTDPLQLGFTRQALVGISVEGDVRGVADKIGALAEVDYVVMCAGSFDLLVELVCENDDRLLRLLNDSIRSIPGVRSTETFLYLKLAKQTYTWGTDDRQRTDRRHRSKGTPPSTTTPGATCGCTSPGWGYSDDTRCR